MVQNVQLTSRPPKLTRMDDLVISFTEEDVTLLVVDCSLAYIAIIRQPTLNAWRVATSTYHLLLKFPTKCGIGKALEDQMAARECSVAMLEMDEQMTTINIEEQQVNVEPTKGLETISLDDEHTDRITHISTQASPSI